MSVPVHLVGSVGLDTAQEVFAAAGRLLGPSLRRVPDGEPGGRRLWTGWQYPVLRGSPFLKSDLTKDAGRNPVGFFPLTLADGVEPADIRFGELGYAREARASYQDFCAAREAGMIPAGIRFQVCLPTPLAVVTNVCAREAFAAVEPPYEAAMLREVDAIAAAIPHQDLCLQWDVCMEMLMWDGRRPHLASPFPDAEAAFRERFHRLSQSVPAAVELGFHLCYGDLDAKHSLEPADAGKMVEMADLLVSCAGRAVAYVHMPVPIERTDDAFFAPLAGLRLPPGTELYLGLVHAADGVEGTRRRMAAAQKFAPAFGIGSECGISRARTPERVVDFLRVYAGAAGVA
jgi:hypothetical protein